MRDKGALVVRMFPGSTASCGRKPDTRRRRQTPVWILLETHGVSPDGQGSPECAVLQFTEPDADAASPGFGRSGLDHRDIRPPGRIVRRAERAAGLPPRGLPGAAEANGPRPQPVVDGRRGPAGSSGCRSGR